MPPKKEFYCDCRQYCRSQRRQVSRTTYYNHAHYRNLPLLQALRLALGASDSAEPTGIQSTHTRSTKRHRTQRRGQQRVAGSSSSAGTHAGADLQGASGNAELEPPGSQPVQADPREYIPQPPVGTEHSSVEEPESGTHGAAGSLPKPTSEEPKHATAVIERMRHPRRHGDLPDLTPPERSQQLALWLSNSLPFSLSLSLSTIALITQLSHQHMGHGLPHRTRRSSNSQYDFNASNKSFRSFGTYPSSTCLAAIPVLTKSV
ncbi:hypothetical protein BD309DRAFT_1046413 [Dichomitus squalens]|uniref:Uncharacterized protein n=1 Tax=Dichomitus squalens TaxID=114155 RepID=A0A4Q9MTR5_9APHY|nr:hypothetical protein BD311DRAFT_825712 [Dichomitus squalens]TBU40501.1 hypothetical protein BD309DRAFT_1046413 [Dichomitus squalens]